jgi:hypothetical protein
MHLGECVVQFQRIDGCLSICIGRMIGRDRRIGAIVTSEMSYRTKVTVFGALFARHLRCEILPTDVLELIARLHWAEEERNKLVHSLWDASETKPDSILREKKAIRKRAYRVTAEHLTPEDLEELSRLFEGVITDIIYLTSEHLPKLANSAIIGALGGFDAMAILRSS